MKNNLWEGDTDVFAQTSSNGGWDQVVATGVWRRGQTQDPCRGRSQQVLLMNRDMVEVKKGEGYGQLQGIWPKQ